MAQPLSNYVDESICACKSRFTRVRLPCALVVGARIYNVAFVRPALSLAASCCGSAAGRIGAGAPLEFRNRNGTICCGGGEVGAIRSGECIHNRAARDGEREDSERPPARACVCRAGLRLER